ncbi:MAG: TrmH family RNA methyltransferase [Pseudomonadota bacterium]
MKPELAAFQPDIPQNLGAMIRLSACFDTRLHIIEPCGFPLSLKALRRTAMDYADVAQMVRHPGWGAFLANHGPGRRILLTTAGDVDLWDFAFAAGDVLILGRESAGAPDFVHHAVEARVRVPIATATRSLNLVTAAAIALAEALRQTRA